MIREGFDKAKTGCLSRKDKSSVGKWDEKIIELCEKINNNENYYTTSSCSGRASLMIDQNKKASGLFLKNYHNKFSFEELKEKLEKFLDKGNIKFKLEPCLVTVACRSLDSARELFDKAAGLRMEKIWIDFMEKKFYFRIARN